MNSKLPFGMCTYGDGVIRSYYPHNSISLSDMLDGIPVATKGNFSIIPATSYIGFIGIIGERDDNSCSYPVIQLGSICHIVVRCKKSSGILAGDPMSIEAGRFVKAVEGNAICGYAKIDAYIQGDDDATTMMFMSIGATLPYLQVI